MQLEFKKLIRAVLEKFDLSVVSASGLRTLEGMSKALEHYDSDYLTILSLPPDKRSALISLLSASKAQLHQDLFVLATLDFKSNGYFVEFGATNGIDLSNTYLLEKSFGWSGILAEPSIGWHKSLRANRSCHIETRCVWRDSKSVLRFYEADEGEFSTIDSYRTSDAHKRTSGRSYNVDTISLNDLLSKYRAPAIIDYLSIDTEGSEFEILSNLDFSRYQFKAITCEHNFTPQRQKIYDLLAKNGYERRLIGISKWDDWYIRS